eukprot:4015283-Pyramimonas_sp.AAC.1
MLEPPCGGTLGHCCATAPPPDLASLQVGNYEFLKNYRKGLREQVERSRILRGYAAEVGDREAALE